MSEAANGNRSPTDHASGTPSNPWWTLIFLGVLLQGVGGAIAGITRPHTSVVDTGLGFGSDDFYTVHHGSVGGFAVGLVIAWIGVTLLAVGLVAWGVYLGTRHLNPSDGSRPPLPITAPQPPRSPHPASDDVFTPRADDSEIVAQIRATLSPGGSGRTVARRRINAAAGKGVISTVDRQIVEELMEQAKNEGR